MCFPCVLERQTQLHFNDTQMLQGFRMHVYVCMCVCVLFFAFDHFSEKPIGATLVVYNYSLRQPHSSSAKLLVYFYICVSVSVHVSAYVNIYANQIEFETLR